MYYTKFSNPIISLLDTEIYSLLTFKKKKHWWNKKEGWYSKDGLTELKFYPTVKHYIKDDVIYSYPVVVFENKLGIISEIGNKYFTTFEEAKSFADKIDLNELIELDTYHSYYKVFSQ